MSAAAVDSASRQDLETQFRAARAAWDSVTEKASKIKTQFGHKTTELREWYAQGGTSHVVSFDGVLQDMENQLEPSAEESEEESGPETAAEDENDPFATMQTSSEPGNLAWIESNAKRTVLQAMSLCSALGQPLTNMQVSKAALDSTLDEGQPKDRLNRLASLTMLMTYALVNDFVLRRRFVEAVQTLVRRTNDLATEILDALKSRAEDARYDRLWRRMGRGIASTETES